MPSGIWSFIGMRRSSGRSVRQRACRGPAAAIRATSSPVVRCSFIATWWAVTPSMIGPPPASLPPARNIAAIRRRPVKLSVIPSTCPAIARTSQAGQSVGRAHSSGERSPSSATIAAVSSSASVARLGTRDRADLGRGDHQTGTAAVNRAS